MLRGLAFGLWMLLRAVVVGRAALVIENLALRQQLAVLQRQGATPRLRPTDRALWILLRRRWSRWTSCLVIVDPDTVVSWHRRGFRWVGRWKSRKRQVGRPRIAKEIRDLILRMAAENRWGAPRIHGELLKLGIAIDERTVSRYLPKRPVSHDRIRRWKAFLRNHRGALAGMDFFAIPTAAFSLLWVFFVIRHDRRRIVHFGVTDSPDVRWIIQNLREAFPFNTSPRFVVMDRDSKYGKAVPDALRRMGTEPVRCAYRAPWQNGVAERWIGSVRRELLDHVVVLNADHLTRLLSSFVGYYNRTRCHLGVGKDSPEGRDPSSKPSTDGTIVAFPGVGRSPASIRVAGGGLRTPHADGRGFHPEAGERRRHTPVRSIRPVLPSVIVRSPWKPPPFPHPSDAAYDARWNSVDPHPHADRDRAS